MTEQLPEPSRDRTPPSAHLRASDRDREQVATVVNAAYAEGKLTADEHEERLDQVLRARTFGDLAPLTQDLLTQDLLTQTHDPRAQPQTAHVWAATGYPSPDQPGYTLDTTHATGDADLMIGVFSGTTRQGRWRVRRHLRTVAVFGGVDLDLTQAVLESRTTEIAGLWLFGGLDVKVPAGMTVRNQVVGIFGGADVRHVEESDPNAPVLVLKGLALFGGVNVRGPKPPKKQRW